MDFIKSKKTPKASALVAANSISAKQTAIYIAQVHLSEGLQAWEAPTVSTYQAWVSELYLSLNPDSRRSLLNAAQSRALWQKVIQSSYVSENLIGTDNLVDWAMDARRKLSGWRLKPENLEKWSNNIEVTSLCRWSKDYEQILKTEGWIDFSGAENDLGYSHLKSKENQSIIWTGMDFIPTQSYLFDRFAQAGHDIKTWQPDNECREVVRTKFSTFSDEIEASAKWARNKLIEKPKQRLAIVIPTLGKRRQETHRIINEILDPTAVGLAQKTDIGFFDLSGNVIDQNPIIGSALTALDLFSADGGFNEFSRWLRSSFYVDTLNELGRRAVLESRLRLKMEVHLDFLTAFKKGGLAEYLRSEDSQLATLLQGAVKLVDNAGNWAVPSDWAQLWGHLLRQLHWQQSKSYPEGLSLWESALNEFVQLTPILGEITAQTALKELRRILNGQTRSGPLPVHGLFLLQRLEDVGFGYDGIWATGLANNSWPIPASPNPILPLALQSKHGMPLATPEAALEYSHRITSRIVKLAPKTILSWHCMSGEESIDPSPLILPYKEFSITDLSYKDKDQKNTKLINSNAIEIICDDPPPIQGEKIFGGSYTLDMQSKCPLKAFFLGRLKASTPEPIVLGLSPMQRGIVIHKAMELLLSKKPTQTDIENWTEIERNENIAYSVEHALGALFGKSRAVLKNLFESEYRRMESILNTYIDADLRRSYFEINALEKKICIDIDGLKINFKIDRLDTLKTENNPSELLIIDYKTGTGSSPNPSNWFNEQPSDIQLPLYALAVKENVGGVVVARLAPDKTSYSGYWQAKGAFPGRPSKLSDQESWDSQLSLWQSHIEKLVQEYAQGDSRLFIGNLDEAKKTFAPLTRVYEQAALVEHSIDGESSDQ